MTAHRGGLLVSGRYGVSERFRWILLNRAVFSRKAILRAE